MVFFGYNGKWKALYGLILANKQLILSWYFIYYRKLTQKAYFNLK
jgi:hypothetical protein